MSGLPPNCPPGGFGMPQYFSTGSNGQCQQASSFFGGKPPLDISVGYAVVLGFGAFFAVFTSWLVWLEQRYVGTRQSSEWFNTAGRNVRMGLIASVIVSQWTWAATILQSSNVAWQDGVSGPFWYASGATIQVLLFGIIAIEIKRKAPNAHTVCEIVKARWGTAAHIVFLCFCFLTNMIVTAMLLLGGSAVVNALTGLNIYLASFLIPLGVIFYTLAGGLKATFLASYIHSVIVHIILLIFVFLVYCTSSWLGSPSAVYNDLTYAASPTRDCSLQHPGQHCGPVSGNKEGSYVTMMSINGFVFGLINIVGNFGTVFVDNGYWMSAIAAKPSSTHKGYLLGGLVWFAVPFSLGTSLGLGAVALGLPLTQAEANQGLVPPATAVALMGNWGAVLILVMLFMAVTSAGSAELVAVSTLVTYDIYRTYINPKANGKQILLCSRIMVLAFGLLMGVLAIALNQAGVSLGWMYLVMGVLIGSAVVPIANVILWKKANGFGAIAGCLIGMVAGITSWLVVAKVQFGVLDLDSTGANSSTLTGNLVSIITGGTVHAICSFIKPDNYDFEGTRCIALVDADGHSEVDPEEYSQQKLSSAKKWIFIWGSAFTIAIAILWPILSLPAGVFSLGYFTFWAVISIVWGFIGSAIIILLPLYESWADLCLVANGMFTNDLILEKVDDVGLKVTALMSTNQDAEKHYLLHKEQMKELRSQMPPPALEHKELVGEVDLD
ncbi:unnamed protein product [Closterium sp. Naga37s-1]|nr:unnamed protein product [Closterium sp. Naga37s-1]